MNIKQFSNKMRLNRGALRNVQEELNSIWLSGSERLMEYTLNNKTIGVKKTSHIASELSEEEQDKFVDWLLAKRRTMKEIDSKLLETI